MNIFDILILAFLVIGISVGLYRGFFKELVGTVGLLLSASTSHEMKVNAKTVRTSAANPKNLFIRFPPWK